MTFNIFNRPLGIMFHHFHDDAKYKPGQGSLSTTDFEDILEYLGHERILSAEVWAERALENRLSPEDLCLTFDDALRCQYDIALPVLRRLGLTAFWFIYTATLSGGAPALEAYRKFRCEYYDTVDDFYGLFFQIAANQIPEGRVIRALREFPANYLAEFKFYSETDRKFRYLRDRILGPKEYKNVMDRMIASRGVTAKELVADVWLEPNHIKVLKEEGHVIGLHSHSHPTLLEAEAPDEQYAEYKSNLDILSDLTRARPFTMAHPCNSYSNTTLDILSGLGIKLGFRSNMVKASNSLLELPREDAVEIRNRCRTGSVNHAPIA